MANDLFRAIGHPLRRGVIERLAAGPATVGEVTRGFPVSKPTISRHLKVLQEVGVIEREVVGREHILRLHQQSMAEVVDWVDRQRTLWERMFDAVGDRLKEMAIDEQEHEP